MVRRRLAGGGAPGVDAGTGGLGPEPPSPRHPGTGVNRPPGGRPGAPQFPWLFGTARLFTVNVSPVLPWDLTPVFEQHRLVTLAAVAVATRNRAFSEADREAGDTNWGLACKAHERLMCSLARLSGEHPWLKVVREGLYVMPLIEDVPVRLYRGAPDRPGSRHLDAVRGEYERSKPAHSQMTFDFLASAADGGPWYWLMAMETDAAGMVSRVVFIQANDAGETRHPWECPLEARVEEAPVPPPAVQLVAPAGAGASPPRRGRRGQKAAALPAQPALDRQEELWSAALGAE